MIETEVGPDNFGRKHKVTTRFGEPGLDPDATWTQLLARHFSKCKETLEAANNNPPS